MKPNRFTIGVLIGNANSPHTLEVMKGIHQSAKEQGVQVLFFLGIHSTFYYRAYFGNNPDDDYDYQFNVVYDYSHLGKVDALIIAYGSMGLYLDNISKAAFLKRYADIPQVLLEDTDDEGVRSSIIADNYNGVYTLVEHLVRDHGCRDLTFLSGPSGNKDSQQRQQAFLDVLAKYHLPSEPERIEIGDYTHCVDRQVSRLLTDYPSMDAMVCANDIMASTAYTVCKEKGLQIGSDIRITGFDDWSLSASLNPPLTTVMMDSFLMGRKALSCAVSLCKGEPPCHIVLPARIRYRASCGCVDTTKDDFMLPADLDDVDLSSYLKETADLIAERAVIGCDDPSTKEHISDLLLQFLKIDPSDPSNKQRIMDRIGALLSPDTVCYISPHILLRNLLSCIHAWISRNMELPGDHKDVVDRLIDLRDDIEEMVLIRLLNKVQTDYQNFQQESWFLPMISHEMISSLHNEKLFYASTMNKLSALGLRNSYLFLFEEPISHPRGKEWVCPDTMYLAAYHVGDKVISYDAKDRPVLSSENGLRSFHIGGGQYCMSIFCLYSGEYQYGILLTEIDPDRLGLAYLISTQTGNTLKYLEMYKKQDETQRRLEKLLEELNEKNEMLNYMLEYDQLTGCLNRRGFFEKATELCKTHPTQQALFIICDLDHLKEINDTYGHTEGDYAICKCAEILRCAIGSKGIAGRIGGDEFVALLFSDQTEIRDQIQQKIDDQCNSFNSGSGRPYYVEMSTGYHFFVYLETPAFTEVMSHADADLYEAKKLRRLTVQKH
ncbi:MAG: GGDEF domain-containing protein [Blautia sp.]|nr:GGDEF domain-containing protein [Blautia sp.]